MPAPGLGRVRRAGYGEAGQSPSRMHQQGHTLRLQPASTGGVDFFTGGKFLISAKPHAEQKEILNTQQKLS
jgi:hypothetical protein